MSPEFAKAVDPVFLHVIGALEKLQTHQTVDPVELRSKIMNEVRTADDRLRGGKLADPWTLARYGLCSWIDDVMITRTWQGQKWWEDHKIEFELFNSNDAGTSFFQRALQAEKLTNRDALEVFYVCVVLGFRGLYAMNDARFLAQQYSMPSTIEEWCQRTASLLQTRSNRAPLNGASRGVEGAPPLEGRFTIVGASICLLMLAIALGAVSYRQLYLGEQQSVRSEASK